MSADRRQFDAQYGGNLSAVAAKCRSLEAEVARLNRILDAVRAECRTFPSESWYGRAIAKVLGDAP